MSSCHSLENASTLSGVSFVSNYIFILAGANFRPSVPIFGVYAIILGILTYFFFSKAKIPLMQLSMVLSCLCAA